MASDRGIAERGFILTRHVRNAETEEYWREACRCIQRHYPGIPIVIIDDCSPYPFLQPAPDGVQIVPSAFPGRGELLPFLYLLRHRWFNKAVILHDSVFVHTRVPFFAVQSPVVPLWHAPLDKTDATNVARLLRALPPCAATLSCSAPAAIRTLSAPKDGAICFGCMCVIDLDFLTRINHKYMLHRLIDVVRTRADRCSLERIMGGIFFAECPALHRCPSLFGNIFRVPNAWTYSWPQYLADYSSFGDANDANRKQRVVKVWTGR